MWNVCKFPDKIASRFEAKTFPEPNTGCWLWGGAINDKGYGQMHDGKSTQYAHRISYRLHKGEIPEGIFVCHSCDNPICVNPEHLFLGTAQDNVDDMHRKGRAGKELIPHYLGTFGERHPASKLKESDVRNIRSLRKKGIEVKEIVRLTGLNKHSVHAIIYRPIWNHVKI